MTRSRRRKHRRTIRTLTDLLGLALLAGAILAAFEMVSATDYPTPPVTGHQLADEYSRDSNFYPPEWRE